VGDLLLALLVFTVLVAGGLAVLAGLTVVPFVVALRLAEARALSPGRVGTAAAAGVLLGLALAGSALLLGATPLLVLPAVALVWAVPLALRVLGAPAIAGRAGRHE
jgi:hypothetical protein